MRGSSVQGLCRQAGMSRQAYYKEQRVRRREHIEEDLVVALVREQRAMHPRMGARKLMVLLAPELAKAGVSLGRDRFYEILRRNQLLVKRKRRGTRTTCSEHSLPVYRNLLYDREPTAIDQVWVADLTYLDTDEGFVYLSLVTDLVSRKIVGWNLSDRLEASESVKALEMAIGQLPPDRWPIHHSDRGSQYCCREYVQVLQARGLSISMTEANHCYENAYAERVNGTLKNEYNLDLRFRTKAQALPATAEAIHMYNHLRPHQALSMRIPSAAHRRAA